MNATAERTRQDPRWAAVLTRDAKADGRFVYSVRSTGVYCRPSCASRRARPENVAFHRDCAAAEAAGFRPCRRCLPHELAPRAQQARKVAQACRSIESAEHTPGLTALAQEAGLSPYHFQRVFKAIAGLTPRQYAQAHRAGRLRRTLASGGSVTAAIYTAGYGSSSRLYEQAGLLLGMSPATYREGGAGSTIRFAVGECSLGAILVAATDVGICSIAIGPDPGQLTRELEDRFPKAQLLGGDAAFERTVAQVVGFVEQPRLGLQLPLDVRGTAFQRRVWQALLGIPAGSTASYTQIAKRIGKPAAVRAVAQACAANTLAVAIPCHRVVRKDGALSGYRWGVVRKKELLKRETATP